MTASDARRVSEWSRATQAAVQARGPGPNRPAMGCRLTARFGGRERRRRSWRRMLRLPTARRPRRRPATRRAGGRRQGTRRLPRPAPPASWPQWRWPPTGRAPVDQHVESGSPPGSTCRVAGVAGLGPPQLRSGCWLRPCGRAFGWTWMILLVGGGCAGSATERSLSVPPGRDVGKLNPAGWMQHRCPLLRSPSTSGRHDPGRAFESSWLVELVDRLECAGGKGGGVDGESAGVLAELTHGPPEGLQVTFDAKGDVAQTSGAEVDGALRTPISVAGVSCVHIVQIELPAAFVALRRKSHWLPSDVLR